MRVFLAVCFFTLAVAALAWQGHDNLYGYPTIPFDHPAIRYMDATPADPVAKLEGRLAKGQAKLDFDPKFGYLPALLKNLGVPVESQTLVFSKTSFQPRQISPRRPRSIYFSDEVSVAVVQGSDALEIMSLDPVLGYVFYTLDTARTAKPEFVRRGLDCLQCHIGPATISVPGMMVSSAIVTPDGSRSGRVPNTLTDQRIPLANRWGGWYVTGTHGKQTHNGNAFAMDPATPDKLDRTNSLNLTSLAGRVDTSAYLTPTSDLVALMTLEHQSTTTNMLLRLGWEARVAQQEGKSAAFGPRMDEIVDDLLPYFTFANEAQLQEPVKGVSSFASTFAQRGPRDKQGRGLRDFDLNQRLFRYPVSYLIYSSAFDALPQAAKDRTYRKLHDALTGTKPLARFTKEERAVAVEIVRDTKPNLPAYWK